MKKILLFLLLMNCLATSFAQIDSGRWMIGIQTNGNLSQENTRNTMQPENAAFRESDLDLNIWVTKYTTKKLFYGIGLYNKSTWNLFIPPVFSPGMPQRYDYLETFGVQFQIGKYKSISKNLYLNSGVILGVGKVNRSDKYSGYEIRGSLRPLELGYLFNKRFLFQANLFQLNFNYWNLNTHPDSPIDGETIQYSHSLNPFQNNFSIFYLLKRK
ncbi:MAG: hypothetical protein ACOVNY_10365 [Chitinophagaceae bacterium]